MARPKQNLYGQEMGSKGFLTREKIIEATTALLSRGDLRNLRVAEIGQQAGVSTSTFYLYFESVNDAGLAAVERVEQATPEIMSLLETQWTSQDLLKKSKAFVSYYFAVWHKNQALLRVRNFMADEGDRRFHDVRRRAVEPIHLQLQSKIAELQADLPEHRRLHPPSTASVVLAMLERTSQVVLLPSAHKATRPRQIETASFLVACALSGGIPFADDPEDMALQAQEE